MDHFSRIYPTTLEEFEAIGDDHPLRLRESVTALLRVSIEIGVDELFPALYYVYAGNPDPQLQDLFPNASTGWATLNRLFKGREALGKVSRRIMSIFMAISEGCVVRHQIKNKTYNTHSSWRREYEAVFDTHTLWYLSGDSLGQVFPQRICDSCPGFMKEQIDKERKEIWEEIPGYFGLKSWEDIRAELKTLSS